MGIDCYRVQFPKGMDANEYALQSAARGEESGHPVEQGARGWARASGQRWR